MGFLGCIQDFYVGFFTGVGCLALAILIAASMQGPGPRPPREA